MTDITQSESRPTWIDLSEQHGGILGEHPELPLRDWLTEVAHHNQRLGYWEWVEQKIETAIPSPVTEPPMLACAELPVQFRPSREFEVVVYEVIKIKIKDITATSFAEATEKAAEISANYRNFLSRRDPDGCIDYIEPAEEQVYYLADLMDENDDKDIQQSYWISGAWRLDAATPTLEEALAQPYVALPESPRAPVTDMEINWDRPRSQG